MKRSELSCDIKGLGHDIKLKYFWTKTTTTRNQKNLYRYFKSAPSDEISFPMWFG